MVADRLVSVTGAGVGSILWSEPSAMAKVGDVDHLVATGVSVPAILADFDACWERCN